MSRYVFLNFPAQGHVNPTLAIVRELVAKGEDVIYFLPEHFRSDVESIGATFRPYAWLSESPLAIADAVRPDLTGDARIAMLPVMMAEQSPRIVPQLIREIETIQPDCLVYDGMFLWGRLAAAITGIRAVGLRPSHTRPKQSSAPGWLEKFPAERTAAADRALAQLAEAYGRPHWTLRALLAPTEQLVVVFLPREFQVDGDTFDHRFLFVGPSLRPADPMDESVAKHLKADSRLKLYIALGTVFNRQPEFYGLCLHAFAGEEWQIVMSVGPNTDLASLGTVPDNFLIMPRAPQLTILPEVDAFVCHGGMNSVMESLYHGVPLVVLPSIMEQRLTASRVHELGLGLALEHEGLTAEVLCNTTRRVARELEFRSRVRTMQNHVRAAGGFRRATDEIVEFVHRS